MSKDKDLDWIEKSGGFEWTPGSPWPPEVKIDEKTGLWKEPQPYQHSDEEADSGDTYTVAFDHLMNEVKHSDYYYDYTRNDPDRKNPFTDPEDRERAFKVTGNWEEKTKWIYESPDKGKTVYRYVSGRDPSTRERVIIDDGAPKDILKYQEDKSLKDLKEYVNTTYEGHYTSDQGDNVQTLDIIESVGDAKSFCRSNAIKYLTRYEKKGQAKRDILKAAHYCLLLYYFDGHTN